MESTERTAHPPTSGGGAAPSPTHASDRRRENSRRRSIASRRDSVIMMFVALFLLNSLNGRAILKSVNSQYEEMAEYSWNLYYGNGTNAAEAERTAAAGENKTEDVAIIITSSWIPTHPSTFLVEAVINSTENLVGLSPTAPIFIMVDQFRHWQYDNTPEHLEKVKALDQYTIGLYNLYLTDPRIHIVPNMRNWHIGGSVNKALDLIENLYPSVDYVYYLQHDFFFFRRTDHTALIKAMNDHPDKINHIRFPKKSPHYFSRSCGQEAPIRFNHTGHEDRVTEEAGTEADADVYASAKKLAGQEETSEDGGDDGSNLEEDATADGDAWEDWPITLWPTNQYSDNNHLVRRRWYSDLIKSMVKLDRPPEDPLQKRANAGCMGAGKLLGLYLYSQHNLGHLDGRRRSELPV